MLNLNSITTRLFPSSDPAPALPTIGPGTQVEVQTLCYGKQIGTIQYITDSPFIEDAPGTQRAFVVGNGWTDYLLLEDIAPDAPDFELEDDFDYLQYLHDLAKTECEQELEDEDEYQHPRFLWNGRWFPESID